jgi:hypothetical protein
MDHLLLQHGALDGDDDFIYPIWSANDVDDSLFGLMIVFAAA